MTFSCSFHLIWRMLLSTEQVKEGTNLGLFSAIFKLITSALFSTPLMMFQMAFLQLISGDSQGLPTIRSFLACIAIYLILIYFQNADEQNGKNLLKRSSGDGLIKLFFTFFFVFFVANMIISVPENHMSTGVHQTVGDCNEFDLDLTGHKRQVNR